MPENIDVVLEEKTKQVRKVTGCAACPFHAYDGNDLCGTCLREKEKFMSECMQENTNSFSSLIHNI